MADAIQTVEIKVFVQENGIIRLSDTGKFLGRLDGVSFEELISKRDDVFSEGDRVRIVESMAPDWVGKEAVITKVISSSPICYGLDIGGGHWLRSTLERI